jgi:hypothetical protein
MQLRRVSLMSSEPAELNSMPTAHAGVAFAQVMTMQ